MDTGVYNTKDLNGKIINSYDSKNEDIKLKKCSSLSTRVHNSNNNVIPLPRKEKQKACPSDQGEYPLLRNLLRQIDNRGGEKEPAQAYN